MRPSIRLKLDIRAFTGGCRPKNSRGKQNDPHAPGPYLCRLVFILRRSQEPVHSICESMCQTLGQKLLCSNHMSLQIIETWEVFNVLQGR
eukprot:4452110-Amphidinium_carterae.2